MAPLASYTQETAEVSVKGVSFAVRGLGLDDVSLLVRAHFDALENLFALYQSATAGPEAGDPGARLILSFVQDAPALCAQIIAIAADEPDRADVIRKMPFPVLVDALLKIGRLTFEDVGGPANFMQALVGLLERARKPTSARLA